MVDFATTNTTAMVVIHSARDIYMRVDSIWGNSAVEGR